MQGNGAGLALPAHVVQQQQQAMGQRMVDPEFALRMKRVQLAENIVLQQAAQQHLLENRQPKELATWAYACAEALYEAAGVFAKTPPQNPGIVQ